MRLIGLASVAAGFPGFRLWSFACDHNPPVAIQGLSTATPYQPLFFSEKQYRLVARIAEMIIPSDDTPGAREAGVPEFIDFMVANRVPVSPRRETRCTQDAIESGNEAQTLFLAGLGWVDSRSFSEFGKEFMDCSPEQQNALLEELAYKAKFKPTTESGREFFRLLREYTVVGYYTSKIGLETLGYPGLRTAWPSMPACSHPDDPEHVRLPPAEKLAKIGFTKRARNS
jgi:gluconate 2-dehydrogenase gamma chain